MLLSPLFVRIWTAGSAFLAALALASLIGPDIYGPIALALFIAKVSPVLAGGASYGFIKMRLGGATDEAPVRGFLAIYQLHLAVGIILLSWLLNPHLAWLALALLPIVAIEPVEKLQERLHYAFLPDIACFVSGLLAHFLLDEVSVQTVAPIALLLSLAVHLHSRFRLRGQGIGDRAMMSLRKYGGLMRDGASLQLATVLIASVMMLDRYFISTYWGAALLGVFMLAYQLAQAATFPAQSLTQLYLLRYPQLLARNLSGWAAVKSLVVENRIFSILAVAAPFVAIVVAFVYALLFDEFAELPLFAALLTSSAVVWAICNAQLPRLFFSNRMSLLIGPMVLLILMDLTAHVAALKLDGSLLIVPAVQLLLFSGVLYRVTRAISAMAAAETVT
jgi:hypothetical protein